MIQVKVSYGADPGSRFRIQSEVTSATRAQGGSTSRRPQSAHPVNMRECPIYNHRQSRGRSDDPWATTAELSFQAPPSTNNYLAMQEFDLQERQDYLEDCQ